MSFVESAKGQTGNIQLCREHVVIGSVQILQALAKPSKLGAENGFQLCLNDSAHGVARWRGMGWSGTLHPSGLYKYHFLCMHEKKKAEMPCFGGDSEGVIFLDLYGLVPWEINPKKLTLS